MQCVLDKFYRIKFLNHSNKKSGFLIPIFPMKNNKLPFQIGNHYENWEFDLEPTEKERILGFDSYIYFRELLFLGVIPRYVELIFSWDILKVVIFTVDFKTKQEIYLFKDSLDFEFIKSNQFYIKEQLIERFELDKSIELWLVNLQDNYRVEIFYGEPKYLRDIYTL